MTNAMAGYCNRMDNAFLSLVSCIAESGDISVADAEAVANLYLSKSMRIAKLDGVLGRFSIAHGSFFDKDVIRRALLQVIQSR